MTGLRSGGHAQHHRDRLEASDRYRGPGSATGPRATAVRASQPGVPGCRAATTERPNPNYDC